MDWERHFRAMKKPQTSFGAEARGTAETGTGGAVIPPGRYWLDAFGPKIQVFETWAVSKPEVLVEQAQDATDGQPQQHMFYIFTIPKTANNFGIPGVLFPTVALGFPEVADKTVQTSDDTVQRPEVTQGLDGLFQSLGLESGTTPPPPGKGWWPPSTATLIEIAIGVGVVIAVATLPGVLLKKVL